MPKSVKKATALSYRSNTDSAPRVIAKGSGAAAENIVTIAEQHGIPCISDPDLAVVLTGLDLGSEIPAELYHAVAEVLAFVYRMNQTDQDV